MNYNEGEEKETQSISVGDELDAKVTRIEKYGAFMALPGGLTGLLHISEIANTFIKSCLLYTSPSPRDQRGSRMPSSA